jgi:drug/metabolite transporter (DMT)-like permease
MALRDLGVLIAICLVWAGNSVMSKVLISHYGVPPLFYAAGRFVVVVIATLRWLLPAPRPLWRMIAVGILMGGGSFALSFMGLKTATPSDFAVVSQIGVPTSALLSVVMLGERIRWRRALGIVLALSGVLIVMWNPAGLTPSPGMLYIAGSAITPALGAVMMKQIEGVSPWRFQAWVGFSSLWPVALLSALTETGQGAVLDHAFWPYVGGVLFSALVVSVAAHTAFYGLIRKYEVNLLQPLTLMTPLATIALGVLITHDPFGPRMAIGTAVALTGVAIIALRRNHVMAPLALVRRAMT